MLVIDRGLLPIGLSLVVLALGAAPALAQEASAGPISTAAASAPPTPVAQAAPQQIGVVEDEDPAGPPLRDNKIHGMVSAGVGTNGYREGSVFIDAPLPNGGDVAIAVDSTQSQYGRSHK
jgi:hypothetical protein